MSVNDNKVALIVDHHPKTDLGEGRAPVSWQLRLRLVKPSLPSCTIVGIFVAPKNRIVMEGALKTEKKNIFRNQKTITSAKQNENGRVTK